MRPGALVLLLGLTACVGCMAPEEALGFDVASEHDDEALEFSIRPDRLEIEAPSLVLRLAVELEQPGAKVRRDPMWRVGTEPGTWLSDKLPIDACEVELPEFPAVSRDGSVLALALVTSPVAEREAAVVRFYRAEDGALLGSHWLLRAYEAPLIETDAELIGQRYCKRLDKLERLLDGEFEAMPTVGGWDNRIREGLPRDVDRWPRVIADGATRDVDMAVADIVVTRPELAHERLRVQAAIEDCEDEDEQFSTVWATDEFRVLTRGPCGC